MKKNLRVLSVGIALPAIVAVSATFALSSKPKAQATTAVTAAPARQGNALTSASARGSLSQKASDDADDHEGKEGKEDEEDTNLTASITPAQARDAALAAQPGTAGEVELEDEDGTVVYGVEISAATNTKYDVKVDANTGKVLKCEVDDEDDEDEKENGGSAGSSEHAR